MRRRDAMERAHTNLAVTVIGVAVIVVLGGFVWFGMGPPAPSSEAPDTAAPPTTVGQGSITVHISGAVARPGLVSIPDGSRMADAIGAAGGALPAADLGSINLARHVHDGDHVIVPVHGEGERSPAESSGIDINTASASELEALPGVGPVLAGRIVAFRTERGPFSSVEDLLDVPGIGEAKLAQMRDAIAGP